MRKEDLDRRCAEMKARMLAQRAAPAQPKSPKVTGRNLAKNTTGMEAAVADSVADDDVGALHKRIAALEAENQSLRMQVAALSSGRGTTTRSADDSVREQRHNFFKYSNVRRY